MKPRVRLKPTVEAIEALPAIEAAGASPAFHSASATLRDMAGWIPARGSADTDILGGGALTNIVYRARDITRNNGVAHAGVQTIVDNVVGTGLRCSPNPDYLALKKTKEWAREWRRNVKSRYHAWWHSTACHAGDTMTGDQLTAQVMFSKINNGASLTLPMWLDRGDGYMTKLQTVEIDRLSNPNGRGESRYFRGGIEFDLYGAPIRYHIRRGHPGDTFFDSAGDLSSFTWEPIDRRTSFGRLKVIHDFDSERSGQSRGVPLMASILPQFKNLDRYQQAELQAAVMNAMIFGTITTPLSGDDIVDLFSKDPAAYLRARAEGAVRMQSGSLLALQPGDELKEFMPQRPATNFDLFNLNIYRIIAAALDIPYELLLKDFSKTNYSSARAAMLEAWRAFSRRRDWLGSMWFDPIYGLWLEEQVHAGNVEAPGFYENRAAYQRCRWIGPGKGWVDPVKEAQAAGIRIENFLSTLEQEAAEQGMDWEELLEQRALERDKMEELNLEMPNAAASYPLDTSSDAPPGTNESDKGSGGQQQKPKQKKAAEALALPAPGAPLVVTTPGVLELAQAITAMAGAMATQASRPQPAPELHMHEGAIRIDNAPPAPPAAEHPIVAAPINTLQRTITEKKVTARDDEGRILRVLETVRTPSGQVLREIEKEVTARDESGSILSVRETELSTSAI